MLNRRELLVMIEMWLSLAHWTRTSIGTGSDDPRDLAELGRAAGLEAAAGDLMELLQNNASHRSG